MAGKAQQITAAGGGFDIADFCKNMEHFLGDQEGEARLFWEAFSFDAAVAIPGAVITRRKLMKGPTKNLCELRKEESIETWQSFPILKTAKRCREITVDLVFVSGVTS